MYFDYYLHKLPVYDYNGNLLLPYMCNLEYIQRTNINTLDIDIRFIKLLGIKNYINPCKNKIFNSERINIDEILEHINPIAFILLAFIILTRVTDRYNLDIKLLEGIKNFDKKNIFIEIPTIKLEHNKEAKDNIEFTYFDIYENKLNLNSNGYTNNEIIKYE